jgi:type II secretory pathway pseudopilin PulG
VVTALLFPRLRAARRENARLRAENERMRLLLWYQRARMKESAAESLGMRVVLAQLAPPRPKWDTWQAREHKAVAR